MRWLVLLLLCAGVGFWAYSIERDAENQARAFCDGVEPGQAFDDVRARAERAGDNRFRVVTDTELLVVFKGVTVFSRHGCDVRAKDGRVQSARYLMID